MIVVVNEEYIKLDNEYLDLLVRNLVLKGED